MAQPQREEPQGPGAPQGAEDGKELGGWLSAEDRTRGVGGCFRGEGRRLPGTVEGKLQLRGSGPMGVRPGAVCGRGVCVGGIAEDANTASCQVEPQTKGAGAKHRRLRWLQDTHSYSTCHPSLGSREPGNLMEGPGSLLNQASGHTHTHIPTPAKFSLHVWKVKPGVIVSLLI